MEAFWWSVLPAGLATAARKDERPGRRMDKERCSAEGIDGRGGGVLEVRFACRAGHGRAEGLRPPARQKDGWPGRKMEGGRLAARRKGWVAEAEGGERETGCAAEEMGAGTEAF